MIDVKKIRDSHPDITNAILAKVLFPKTKNPLASLARVLTGKYELRETQIRKLAELLGISPGDLFSDEYLFETVDPNDDLM